jgi:hypothetical protein
MRTCQPAASCLPREWSVRKVSTAASSSHRANIAIRRSCIRAGETVGAPSRIIARHSAYRNPGVEGTVGAFHSAPAVVVGRSSARWNVKIVIVGQLSHE